MAFGIDPVGGKPVAQMAQSRNQEYAGAGERFVDSQFVEGMAVETEARNCVLDKLTGRAVGANWSRVSELTSVFS